MNKSDMMDHYKAVTNEYMDFYKHYMTAWGVVSGSGFIATILGQTLFKETNSDTLGISLLMVDGILLVWAMLVSWFWAYFVIYRRYLNYLEVKMGGPECVIRIATIKYRFQSVNTSHSAERWSSRFVMILMVVLYVTILWRAYVSLSKGTPWTSLGLNEYICLFALFMLFAAGALHLGMIKQAATDADDICSAEMGSDKPVITACNPCKLTSLVKGILLPAIIVGILYLVIG